MSPVLAAALARAEAAHADGASAVSSEAALARRVSGTPGPLLRLSGIFGRPTPRADGRRS